ncbi:exopolysaccharide biosynthesis protein ExoD [Allostella vacuolata]|nr:exopolysaccharide biosynthesis protein ExoD [Stella vacuolata]
MPVAPMKPHVPTSALLDHLLAEVRAERVTLGWVIDRLGERSFGLVMLVLALLGMLPGVSVLAGMLLAVLAAQMILGRKGPAFPPRVAGRPLSARRLARIVQWARPALRLMERIARPRWGMPFQATKRTVGIVVLLVDALLFAPVPFSNIPPAAAIATIAVAYLEEDGMLLSVALLAGTLLLAIAAAVGWQAMGELGWVEGIV